MERRVTNKCDGTTVVLKSSCIDGSAQICIILNREVCDVAKRLAAINGYRGNEIQGEILLVPIKPTSELSFASLEGDVVEECDWRVVILDPCCRYIVCKRRSCRG